LLVNCDSDEAIFTAIGLTLLQKWKCQQRKITTVWQFNNLTGMAHSNCGWNTECAGKTVIIIITKSYYGAPKPVLRSASQHKLRLREA